jgi:very-short-patch-repair endonuclease
MTVGLPGGDATTVGLPGGGATVDCGVDDGMGFETLTERADRSLAALAARQHGVVARHQLLEAGVTGRQITYRLHTARLHELHRGVYLVGHTAKPPHADEMAALLACHPAAARRHRGAAAISHPAAAISHPAAAIGHPAAAISHRSAAALWCLFPHPAAAPVCVTVPPERTSARPRIEIHRAALERRDIRRRHRLTLTSPPRTILDLAAELGPEDLEQLVAEASYRRLASERELHDQLERNRGKRGNPALRRILELPGGPSRTRSPAERQMLRLLRRARISGYEANARVHGYEVDVLWRGLGFAVEIDGYDGHSGRIAFERDRLKIATLKAHGVDVMPFTPRQLRDDPEGVVARLIRALERAGHRGDG